LVRRKPRPGPEDEEEPAPPVRKKAIQPPEEEESFDEPEVEYREESGFPITVMAAGIFWIVLGGVLVLVLLLALVGAFLVAQGREEKGEVVFGGLCLGLVIGLIGGAFIFVGIQTVLGTARDTLGNGIGSIVFGVLNGGHGLGYALTREYLLSAVSFLCGVGLLTAGVLALVGRDRYKEWRRARRPRRRKRVRRRSSESN
jgi:hypothetical protein